MKHQKVPGMRCGYELEGLLMLFREGLAVEVMNPSEWLVPCTSGGVVNGPEIGTMYE